MPDLYLGDDLTPATATAAAAALAEIDDAITAAAG